MSALRNGFWPFGLWTIESWVPNILFAHINNIHKRSRTTGGKTSFQVGKHTDEGACVRTSPIMLIKQTGCAQVFPYAYREASMKFYQSHASPFKHLGQKLLDIFPAAVFGGSGGCFVLIGTEDVKLTSYLVASPQNSKFFRP